MRQPDPGAALAHERHRLVNIVEVVVQNIRVEKTRHTSAEATGTLISLLVHLTKETVRIGVGKEPLAGT